jgi:short-subunit dehydrogenase
MVNSGKLTGHSALIAGASSPMGLATAKLLAAEDCQLHMADSNEQALDLGVTEISTLYEVDVEPHLTDLTEPINIAVLALECQHANILINALGATAKGGINDLEHEDWTTGFELTLFAAINLTREVLESLYEQGSGIIINEGGAVDGEADENLCIVSVNAALQAFSESLDKRTKREGIRVLTFLPQANISAEENASALNRILLEKLFS